MASNIDSSPPPAQNNISARPDTAQSTRPESADETRVEFNAAVEELLNTIQSKFAGISSEIFTKLDDMTSRLDKLEAELRETSSPKEGNASKS